MRPPCGRHAATYEFRFVLIISIFDDISQNTKNKMFGAKRPTATDLDGYDCNYREKLRVEHDVARILCIPRHHLMCWCFNVTAYRTGCGLQLMQKSFFFCVLLSTHLLHKLVHFHLNDLFLLSSHQHRIWLNLRRRTVHAITFAIREMNTSQLRYIFIFQFAFHDTQPFVNDPRIRHFDTLRSVPSTRFFFNRPMSSRASNGDRTKLFGRNEFAHCTAHFAQSANIHHVQAATNISNIKCLIATKRFLFFSFRWYARNSKRSLTRCSRKTLEIIIHLGVFCWTLLHLSVAVRSPLTSFSQCYDLIRITWKSRRKVEKQLLRRHRHQSSIAHDINHGWKTSPMNHFLPTEAHRIDHRPEEDGTILRTVHLNICIWQWQLPLLHMHSAFFQTLFFGRKNRVI